MIELSCIHNSRVEKIGSVHISKKLFRQINALGVSILVWTFMWIRFNIISIALINNANANTILSHLQYITQN